MYKNVKISKQTISVIDNSVFKDCSANQVFKIVLNSFNSESKLFWERICKAYSAEAKDCITVKLEENVIRRLDKVVDFLNHKYIHVNRVFVMEQLLYQFINTETERIISLNVKGYRSGTEEMIERLKRITDRIDETMPDMIFFQEMRLGESNEILNTILHRSKAKYSVILPTGLAIEQDRNLCICVVLIRVDLIKKCKILNISTDKREWRNRYVKFELNGRVYLNVWIQQTFGNGNLNAKAIADSMWESLMSEVNFYTYSDTEFFILGDFNSCAGTYEDKINTVSLKLFDTKCNADIQKPTSSANILDYAFANRFAVQNNLITTRILQPSVREEMLSDHDALVMTIRRGGERR